MNKTQREIAEQQLQLKTITDDQMRLRANLKEMPPTAAAYKRYLDKFDQQETQIEKYQADIKKMQETEHQQQKEFEDFLGELLRRVKDHECARITRIQKRQMHCFHWLFVRFVFCCF